MKAILNPGDEVVIQEPAWLSYKEQVSLCDAKSAFIPYDCSIENINKYVTNSTKMFIVNNPNLEIL